MQAHIKQKIEQKYNEGQLRKKALAVGLCPDCGEELIATEECLSDELALDLYCGLCDTKHTIWY
jgi:predicted RNA-binding Zn-ribbon protein involved in translation (DUF1610 family)